MIGVVLSAFILGFGLFLKSSKNPGFQNSKKFSTLFIILGLLTLTGKLALMYLEEK